MPGTTYQQKGCDLDGKGGRGACMVLVRESAVGWHAAVSGGCVRALPIGFLGGKARYGTLEVALVGPGVLCLRWGRDGRCGICLEMQHFQTKFPSGIGLPGPSEAENRK